MKHKKLDVKECEKCFTPNVTDYVQCSGCKFYICSDCDHKDCSCGSIWCGECDGSIHSEDCWEIALQTVKEQITYRNSEIKEKSRQIKAIRHESEEWKKMCQEAQGDLSLVRESLRGAVNTIDELTIQILEKK